MCEWQMWFVWCACVFVCGAAFVWYLCVFECGLCGCICVCICVVCWCMWCVSMWCSSWCVGYVVCVRVYDLCTELYQKWFCPEANFWSSNFRALAPCKDLPQFCI
jgi:hypothetical protein